ncbi:putative RNA-binding protein Luc7-like protein 2 [Tanacetum coccineum]
MKLKNRSFWEIQCENNDSWGWKNLLNLRYLVRENIVHQIGNGDGISMWFDNWSAIGPLCNIITYRDLYDARLNASVSVVLNNRWNWPENWNEMFPQITSMANPQGVFTGRFGSLSIHLPPPRVEPPTDSAKICSRLIRSYVFVIFAELVLSVYDSDRRLADHFGGKLHLGYMQIREKLADLMEERSNKRKAPEEDRRTVENLVRSKERSRDVEREGSRDRDRASSRDRDRLRDNDRRSRDRGDRHNESLVVAMTLMIGLMEVDTDHVLRSMGRVMDRTTWNDEEVGFHFGITFSFSSAAALCITMMGVSSAGFAALFISSVTYKMYAEVISLMDCGYVNGAEVRSSGVSRFFSLASEGAYVIYSLLEELGMDQWAVASENRALMCTGVALGVATRYAWFLLAYGGVSLGSLLIIGLGVGNTSFAATFGFTVIMIGKPPMLSGRSEDLQSSKFTLDLLENTESKAKKIVRQSSVNRIRSNKRALVTTLDDLYAKIPCA